MTDNKEEVQSAEKSEKLELHDGIPPEKTEKGNNLNFNNGNGCDAGEEHDEVKKPKAKKVLLEQKDESEEKKNGDEIDDDEEDDAEKLVPVFEQPLEITGKRNRKTVERLSLDTPMKPSKPEKAEVAQGQGTKLGDIPRIVANVNKKTADDLRNIHRVLFSRQGTKNEIKKNIKTFSGFPFSKDTGEYDNRIKTLNKFSTAQLKEICQVIDIERSGTKEQLIEHIMGFLQNPSITATKAPKANEKTPKKDKEGKKRESKKKAPSKETISGSDDDDKDDDDDDDDDDENEDVDTGDGSDEQESKENNDDHDDDDDDDDDDDGEKKKKKKATPKPKPKPKPKKDSKAAEKKPKKTEPKKATKRPKSKASDSGSDDEPTEKRAKGFPSEDELKTLISKIVTDVNIEKTTMKEVVQMVNDKFPGMDLSEKKGFINQTVRELI